MSDANLIERFGKDRMFRSHFVYCCAHGLSSIPENCVIHHNNRDKSDDSLSNLTLLGVDEHIDIHKVENAERASKVHRGRKCSQKTIERMRSVAGRRGNNGMWESKVCHSKETKKKMSELQAGKDNSCFRSDIDPELVRLEYFEEPNIAKISDKFGCSNIAIRNRVQDLNDGCDIEWSEVLSIEEDGEDDVYDIQMEGNSPSFVANGVVVHNCGMQSLLRGIECSTFDMATDTTALFRPGSLNSGQTAQYVRIAKGDEYEYYETPLLKPILGPTKGILVYQEQIMQIFVQLGGFSWAGADKMRKIIGKKLGKDEFEKHRAGFVDGCVVNGIDANAASSLFDKMAEFAAYSFNKCISGDTVLMRPAKGQYSSEYTVREAFKIKNDAKYARDNGRKPLRDKWASQGGFGYGMSMFEDGRIRKNKIVDIQYAGDRVVYRVVMENGNYIDVTDNHKFPTPYGKRMLSELAIGDSLYVCGEYERTPTDNFGFSDSSAKEKCGKKYGERCGFPCGASNPAYTNGSHSKFKEYKAASIASSDGLVCAHCGASGCRIETHHKDGDRSNSEWDNLENLCVSCHKKADYKIGRVKRGEKGYPTLTLKIVSIEEIGVVDTYDVTMDAPHHNFVTSSGIVTCNSHAVAYTMLSFWSMYLKAHFPAEFFAAQLGNSSDERITLLSREAERCGIRIRLPDVNLSTDEYVIDEDGAIVPPLGIVKGIGTKAVEEILRARSDGAFLSEADFLSRVQKRQCNSRVHGALVRAGGFESLGVREDREEERVKNFSELLPTYNNTPKLAKGGGNLNLAELKSILTNSAVCASTAKRKYLMPVFPQNTAKPSIMIINNPVKREYKHLTADSTKFLVTELKEVGILARDIYYTSPVKCFFDPKGSPAQPTKECEGKCTDYLRQEIVAVGPKIIVCFASSLVHLFTGDKKAKMSSLQGQVIYSKQFGCYVLFSCSPQFAFFSEGGENMDKFRAAIQTLGGIFK